MLKGVKKRWLSALRSNRYVQGTERLRSGNKYCCLGVLCDIVNPKGWATDRFEYSISTCAVTTNLPVVMRQKLQISDFHESALINMNDNALKSFIEIADWIEEHL